MRTWRKAMVLVGAVLLILGVVPGAAGAQLAPEAGTADWRTVSSGGNHTCGIRTTGRLYCWGDDTFGQLGNGAATGIQNTPDEVAGGHTDWTAVSAGSFHTCGRRVSGRIYCWGTDTYGAIGDGGAPTDRIVPVQVAGGHTDWLNVVAGASVTCGRRRPGQVWCWGYDGNGAVGDGFTVNTNHVVPTPVAGGHTDWTSVSVGLGSGQVCGIRRPGRLWCWGDDTYGQLGDGGTNTDRFAPRAITPTVSNWTAVASGGSFTCGRRATGRLWCWGSDAEGQLGDGGGSTPQPTPHLVSGGATTWTSLTAGYDTACARRTNRTVWCWGDNDQYGQVGDGSGTDRQTPVVIDGGSTDWSSIDAGNYHVCGRRTTGRLWCWGSDGNDQLGNGALTDNQPTPVEVEA